MKAGYHVTFAAANAWGKERKQLRLAAQLRHMGVDVMPPVLPHEWVLLGPDNTCMYDLIMVTHSSAFELAQGQIMAACPNALLVYDARGLTMLREAREAITSLANKQVRGGRRTGSCLSGVFYQETRPLSCH